MSDEREWDIEAIKRLRRRGRATRGLWEVIQQADAEIDAEDAATETPLPEAEPMARQLTLSGIRAKYRASMDEGEVRGFPGSKPNVAFRLGVSKSTLVRAWNDLHDGNPPEWPNGLDR